MAREPMTDEQVREIALGIFKGEIFTNLQIDDRHRENLTPMIFMPLVFMDQAAFESFIAAEPVLLYAHIKDTFGRGVNGYPIFRTMNHANKTDAQRIMAKYREIKTAIEGV